MKCNKPFRKREKECEETESGTQKREKNLRIQRGVELSE